MYSAPKNGYTLVELLIVISIISILTVVAIVNYKSFSNTQILTKAIGQSQSFLRLAQANATSQTLCSDNQNVGPWQVIFNQGSINLFCGPVVGTPQKTYTFENAQLDTIVGVGAGCSITPSTTQFIVSYTPGTGALSFSYGSVAGCSGSTTWTFNFSKIRDSSQTKSFKLSSGGAIDAQ